MLAFHTPITPASNGAFRAGAVVAKWVSMVCMPARNSANRSRPMAHITASPIAEPTE